MPGAVGVQPATPARVRLPFIGTQPELLPRVLLDAIDQSKELWQKLGPESSIRLALRSSPSSHAASHVPHAYRGCAASTSSRVCLCDEKRDSHAKHDIRIHLFVEPPIGVFCAPFSL